MKLNNVKVFILIGFINVLTLLPEILQFISRPFSHLTISGELAAPNDLAGGILTIEALKNGDSFFGTTDYYNFPIGENIISIYELSQLNQLLIMWLISKILSPSLTLVLIQIIGMTLSCFAVFLLTKELGSTKLMSLFVSLFYLISDVLQFGLGSFTSASFFGIACYGLVFSIRFSDVKKMKYFYLSVLVTFLIFLTDAYIGYFTLFSIVVYFSVFLFRSKKEEIDNSPILHALFFWISMWLILVFLFQTIFANFNDGISRSISNAPISTVFNNLGNFDEIITAKDFAFIPFFGILGFLLMIFSLFINKFKTLNAVSWVSIMLLAISIRPFPLFIFGYFPSVSFIVSNFMPGLVHFHRASWVAYPIFLAIVGSILSQNSMVFGKIRHSQLFKVLIFIFTFLPIYLTSHGIHQAKVTNVDNQIASFISKNKVQESANFLAIPETVEFRRWLWQAYINKPFVNGQRKNEVYSDITSVNSGENFCQKIEEYKVSHILVASGLMNGTIRREASPELDFISACFTWTDSIYVRGFESRFIKFELYTYDNKIKLQTFYN